MLGRYLIEGADGEHNIAAGKAWLERAAAQGVADADCPFSPNGDRP
jgi:hypothetical protein